MSKLPSGPEFEIAALRKKRAEVFDPMAHGTGTVWEDRGTHGTLAAFLKTTFGSITGVGTMTRQVRRPETTADARPLVIGCCLCWGASAVVHGGYYFWKASRPDDATVNVRDLVIVLLLLAAAAGFGAYFSFRIFNVIYSKLIAQEKDAPLFPDPLVYNVTAYAMGPSVLAVVPFLGPPLAFVLMAVNVIRVGTERLRLRVPAALIDAVLGFAALLGLIGGGFLVIWLLLFKLSLLTPIELPEVQPGAKPAQSFIPGL